MAEKNSRNSEKFIASDHILSDDEIYTAKIEIVTHATLVSTEIGQKAQRIAKNSTEGVGTCTKLCSNETNSFYGKFENCK